MNRLKIAQYIALASTLISVGGFLLILLAHAKVGSIMFSAGPIIGIVSYIFGGLLTAFKMAGSIAKWGWIVAPFPYKFLTVIFSFIFAIAAFIYLPIIPVRKAYKESM